MSDKLTLKIDAHQHFWKYDPIRDGWITDEMSIIRKDFLPVDLKTILQENKIDGCVAIQADQSYDENRFLIHLAAENDFIKGIVGWVDFTSPSIEKDLNYSVQFEKMKGFRHILQGEKDRAFMLRPEFLKGISRLKQFNFTYDILIYPDQLRFTNELVERFPDQKFVVDHIAKPNIKKGEINEWEKGIKSIAKKENVFCKISGLVTEADLKNWRTQDFTSYLDIIVDSFGIDRVMFGSDWPVCLLGGSYNQVLNIVKEYFSSFTENEQKKFFGTNAIEFYNLN